MRRGRELHDKETLPYNEAFDPVQYIMRSPECPPDFIKRMKSAFATSGLACTIEERDDERGPQIRA